MKNFQIFRYGIIKYTRRGVRLSITLTYRCNLDCWYCTMKKPTGKVPECKESTFEELKQFMKEFPYPVREVQVTGGAPELHPDFVRFTNWLLEQGYFVQIMTNLLFLFELGHLRITPRLMLCCTYHHDSSLKKWIRNYDLLSKSYRIATDEIRDNKKRLTPKRVKLRVFKKLEDNDYLRGNNIMIRVAPDLSMYNTCYGLYKLSNK